MKKLKRDFMVIAKVTSKRIVEICETKVDKQNVNLLRISAICPEQSACLKSQRTVESLF
jgi:hypothetical protein